MGFHLKIISTNSNIISSLPSFSNIIRLFYKVLLQKFYIEIELLVIYCSVCSGLFSSMQNANSHWLHCILEVNLLGTRLHTEDKWGRI